MYMYERSISWFKHFCNLHGVHYWLFLSKSLKIEFLERFWKSLGAIYIRKRQLLMIELTLLSKMAANMVVAMSLKNIF